MTAHFSEVRVPPPMHTLTDSKYTLSRPLSIGLCPRNLGDLQCSMYYLWEDLTEFHIQNLRNFWPMHKAHLSRGIPSVSPQAVAIYHIYHTIYNLYTHIYLVLIRLLDVLAASLWADVRNYNCQTAAS